jgi:hypothetical protein
MPRSFCGASASALPPAFRPAFRNEDQMTNSAQNRHSLAEDDAERKLGGSAEAPPHKKLRGIGLATRLADGATSGRPIANRPQIINLPHKAAAPQIRRSWQRNSGVVVQKLRGLADRPPTCIRFLRLPGAFSSGDGSRATGRAFRGLPSRSRAESGTCLPRRPR